MSLTYGYLGSTEVSKEILNRISLEPEFVVSFDEQKRDQISGFATYESFDGDWIRVTSINSDVAKEQLAAYDVDVILVMAWQELLDADVLSIPDFGCVGRHLSMLPKRRGRAPVAWTLIHGLNETGVTLFWLDQGVDTGDIIAQQRVPVDDDDEAQDLHDKMTDATVDLLSDMTDTFAAGEFPRRPQNDDEATYIHPRRPDMGLIDWEKSARRLYDFVRGQTHPYPGAFTYHNMDKVTVWHAGIDHPTATRGCVGEVLEELGPDEYFVQTGEGILHVEVENHGGTHTIKVGSILGNAP